MTDFDPRQHLMKLSGKDYLPVAARLLWLRTDYPYAEIKTTLLRLDDSIAVFSAEVSLPIEQGGGTATGHGSEQPQHFKDYVEKAETKAVGRALGMLGFGTQFTYEFDEGERIVDTPQSPPVQTERDLLTDIQIERIKTLTLKLGISPTDAVKQFFPPDVVRLARDLTKSDAAMLIEWLEAHSKPQG